MRRRVWLSPLLLALCVAAQDARSEVPTLWRWTDADGTARYTPDPSRVPSALRGTLARVEPGLPAPPEPEHALKPAAIFAPPGEAPLEADPFNAPAPARRIEAEIVPPVPLQTEPRAASPAAAVAAAPAPKARPPAPAARPPSDFVPVAAVEPEIVSLEPGPSLPAPAPATAIAPSLPAPAPAATVAAEPVPDAAAVPEPAPAVTAALSPELEARRAQLLMEIARDEEALKAHVSAAGGGPLVPSPELHEIAQRLPALQAELRALEAQPPGAR